MFLKISQISLESTCDVGFLDNVPGPQNCTLIKKRLQQMCFPVKFAQFLKTTFLQKSSSGCFWYLTRVFKKSSEQKPVRPYGYQIQLKKIFVAAKIGTSVTNLPKGANSWVFYSFKPILKVQSCKLYNSKYMIASTKIISTEILAFISVLVLKLLSRKVLFTNRKRQ